MAGNIVAPSNKQTESTMRDENGSMLPQGLRLFLCNHDQYYGKRNDLSLFLVDEMSTSSIVSTRNKCCAAPVSWNRERVDLGRARALLINAGNANVFNGELGVETCQVSAAAVSDNFSLDVSRVMLCSTGGIGLSPHPDRIATGVENLTEITQQPDALVQIAEAMMTTDTSTKTSRRVVSTNGGDVTIVGVAKGAGMIEPNMATMLAVIVTDATMLAEDLQTMLSDINEDSFNAITVDGDTSTNDTVVAFATCRGAIIAPGNSELRGATIASDNSALRGATIASDNSALRGAIIAPGNSELRGATIAPGNSELRGATIAPSDYDRFRAAMAEVAVDLAKMIVRDGEGSRKFISIAVTGAASKLDADKVARSVANSPLVKSALSGALPNWGRVIMAIGKSGAQVTPDRLRILFGDTLMASDGSRSAQLDIDGVREYLAGDNIDITIDLGLGDGARVIWTCDITESYVALNKSDGA